MTTAPEADKAGGFVVSKNALGYFRAWCRTCGRARTRQHLTSDECAAAAQAATHHCDPVAEMMERHRTDMVERHREARQLMGALTEREARRRALAKLDRFKT